MSNIVYVKCSSGWIVQFVAAGAEILLKEHVVFIYMSRDDGNIAGERRCESGSIQATTRQREMDSETRALSLAMGM
jgi:hypothetical protein